MKQAIDELKAIPGVVGACLFGNQEGLLQSNLPGIFKPDKLVEVGKQVSKLLTAGRMSFSDINDLALHYDESVVVAREMSKGLIVFAICDPSFNHNLLTMSLNLLQEELRESPPAVAPAPAAGGASPATALDPVLDELRSSLAKILGPMAGIVFDEILEDWSGLGRSEARLPELLALINAEIGDPEKIAGYEALIAPVLQR